ncbi:uncharacterized protein MONBRDRAFT_29233 [Monosiga brevicollis MX1]|uniref:Uncharacterized protein n=1 Tax=Monosiga brevicollis TaxID=81824 RepID=A9VAI0_MONBE|nr:uncharacterized protein MONBRDRAFT_29233 [Monosiga brevicollis MX1]EDQ85490.1 predicted protein [Monosiga brevicollis MX1]|eukprot:XP_001749681.1 hypothetical protein [Monosiga brevicollis MX1]
MAAPATSPLVAGVVEGLPAAAQTKLAEQLQNQALLELDAARCRLNDTSLPAVLQLLPPIPWYTIRHRSANFPSHVSYIANGMGPVTACELIPLAGTTSAKQVAHEHEWRSLSLSFNKIRADAADSLTALLKRELLVLDISHNALGDEGAFVGSCRWVAHGRGVDTARIGQSPDLRGNRIGDKGFSRLTQALQSAATKLQSLDMQKNGLTDASMPGLLACLCTAGVQLHNVNLASNPEVWYKKRFLCLGLDESVLSIALIRGARARR